jgi:bacterioferritin-associated ferredoxin
VLVSGNGPLNLQVAAELVAAGAQVVAVADSGRPTSGRGIAFQAALGVAAPTLAVRGLGYLRTLRRAKVPLLWGATITKVDGAGAVQSATVAELDATGQPVPGSERTFTVDAVCAGFGFQPNLELARALGCQTRWDSSREQLCVVADQFGATSVEGVWVIGDGAAVSGAPSAEADGAIAGAAVLAALGRGSKRGLSAVARLRRHRLRVSQWAVRRLYRAPRLDLTLADPDTVVCRCESVTLGEIEAAAAEQDPVRLATIKRATRVGMGRCQGRYCAVPIARRFGTARDIELAETDLFAPRPPAKPVRIGLIAREEMDRPRSVVADGSPAPSPSSR